VPKQRRAVMPTFEYGREIVVVVTGFWWEVVVEKPHITDDHHDYARIPTESVITCCRRQCRTTDIPNKNEQYQTQPIQCVPIKTLSLQVYIKLLTRFDQKTCTIEIPKGGCGGSWPNMSYDERWRDAIGHILISGDGHRCNTQVGSYCEWALVWIDVGGGSKYVHGWNILRETQGE
jgi:hypothetical protein